MIASIASPARVSSHLESQRCPASAIEEAYTSRRLSKLDGTPIPMNVYIPREQGDFLYSLVRKLRPELTIEVGMANGLSTVFIAEALRQNGTGRHIAIDPFQHSDWGGAGMALVRKAGLESLVELVELPSHQALPELERAGKRPGLVFIDGSHLFDYVLSDFLCTDRLLPPGGLVAFDDSDWPAITAAIRYALTNRHYEVVHSDFVIESEPNTPSRLANVLRRVAKLSSKLSAKLRPDFITPPFDLGLRGRCSVLRKIKCDDRDSQSRFHVPF
jgi:predicted O-methyltransferase YrrM